MLSCIHTFVYNTLIPKGISCYTFQHLVGASYHYWVTTEGGDIQNTFGDYAYLKDHKSELVAMVKTGDDYYLKFDCYIDHTNAGRGAANSLFDEGYEND